GRGVAGAPGERGPRVGQEGGSPRGVQEEAHHVEGPGGVLRADAEHRDLRVEARAGASPAQINLVGAVAGDAEVYDFQIRSLALQVPLPGFLARDAVAVGERVSDRH